MAITAAMVRELREKTGAAMMDCKKALEASNGDLEAAVDHLRKAGLKTAEKKASRSMGEGRVHAEIAADGRSGALVAVTCETDFVARTEDFGAMLAALGAHVLEHAPENVDELMGQSWKAGGTVADGIKEVIGKLGENISVGDVSRVTADGGYVGAYVHHDDKQGAMAAIKTDADAEKAQALIKSLCQHVVVFSPPHLTREDVPADTIEREKAIYREEVQGKPEEIQDKIINGKLEKYYAGVALVEQPWMLDDKVSVQKAVEAELGAGSVITAFVRFRIGE